jgi:hypothetical protein
MRTDWIFSLAASAMEPSFTDLTRIGVGALVLEAVDLLQQVAQTVDEELLFERLQDEATVRRLLNDAERRVALPRRVALHGNALEQDKVMLNWTLWLLGLGWY